MCHDKNCCCLVKWWAIIVGLALVVKPVVVWMGWWSACSTPMWVGVVSLVLGVLGIILGVMTKCDSCCSEKPAGQKPQTPAS